MPRWLRCGFISNEDLLAGRWQQALDEMLALPPPPETIAVDGAERAARSHSATPVGAHSPCAPYGDDRVTASR